jgi:peptide subunit release factor 1 (eRF1)
MVRRLADAVGADNLGTWNAVRVIKALQAGQVATLVIVDDFAAPGWADYTMNVYGAGPVPETHPLGGDVADLVPVDLAQELIRLAVRTGAEIEIVKTSIDTADLPEEIPAGGNGLPRTEAARELDKLGGVGALLRFA